MNYAVIKLGSRQYIVSEGDEITVDHLNDNDKLKAEVLMSVQDGVSYVGSPLLENVNVDLKVLRSFKDTKIRVAKFKAKSRYRKVRGHRSLKSVVSVGKITSQLSNKKK